MSSTSTSMTAPLGNLIFLGGSRSTAIGSAPRCLFPLCPQYWSRGRQRSASRLVSYCSKKGRRKKRSWWQKFFSDVDEESWFGCSAEDVLGVDELCEEDVTEAEKLEAWKSRVEPIVELREAQEDVKNAQNRVWDDRFRGDDSMGSHSSSWDQDWGGCEAESPREIGDRVSSFTVDDALLSIGFGKFQALVLCYAGMGWISEAMEMMLLSFVGPAVQVEWNLSPQQESFVTSVVFAGMLLGAYSWGIISDIHGRRIGFLFTALVTSGAGFLCSFAPNYLSLLLLRFMVGIGLGGGPVLASWFLEFIPAPHRGKWMVIFSAFWTIGTIFEASIAWAIMPRFGWRWLLAFSSLPSFLLLLFYDVTPESPRYLCMKGQISNAMQVLEQMARGNNKGMPLGMLISDNREMELEEITDRSEATHLVEIEIGTHCSLDKNTDTKNAGISALRRLLSQKLIGTTLLLWMVFFGNAFSYYGIILLTSELSNGNRICAAKVTKPNQTTNNNLYKDVLVTSFAEIPGLILSAAMVDRIGRKLSMSSMLFASCVVLIPLLFAQTEELTIALLFCARITISASVTIVYIYAPEIYPTSVRTSGIGIASSVGRIGGITCPLVAVVLVHDCHQSAAILLFELVIFLSGIAVCLFPVETSGRNLSDSTPS